MPNEENYTAKLLEMEDIILTDVTNEAGTTFIHCMMPQREYECPRCKATTSRIHDYRTQTVKDAPMYGRHTVLKIRKRRYVCPVCGKRFYEKVPLLPKYQRTTTRLWAFVLEELSKVQSMKDIASRVGISATSVARILDHLSYDMLHLPDVISIDEFKGNAGGHKFQCIITNPKKRQVLDILPEKTTESLSGYFSRFRDRANVKYIVMDMSCVFRSMANTCFPKAQIVADKYHVQRQVAWAFEDMRKRVQQKFAANRRRYFKRSRYIMLKNIHKLNEEEKQQLTVMLGLSEELAASYFLLQKFYEVMQSKDRVTAKKRLSEWYLHVGSTDSRIYSRFHKCVNTFIEWNDEILNAFETGFTNGYTEGCNNKIKVIKRNAYGLRNFHRFKHRIMHVMA